MLKHWNGDILPPVISLHILDQRHLFTNHGYLFLQQLRYLLDLIAQPLEPVLRADLPTNSRGLQLWGNVAAPW